MNTMAPDTDELIKKINTLTLDKNRLRQKLSQQTNQTVISSSQLQYTNSIDDNSDSPKVTTTANSGASKLNSPKLNKSQSGDLLLFDGGNKNINGTTNIAGIECSSSCEDDLLYINDLYRRRLNEYNDNWDFIQSKCTALLAEVKALQEQYAILKKEKLELQEENDRKCDEIDQIKGELQTVVLNYETQLSAMSEHLSMITSQP